MAATAARLGLTARVAALLAGVLALAPPIAPLAAHAQGTRLQRSKVDVIVVASATGARAARQAAPTAPVVFVAVTDPIGSGIVQSLAHPGGNQTGTSLLIGGELAGKWVELAKDAVPRLSSVAALGHTLSTIAKSPPGALILTASPFFGVHRKRKLGVAIPPSLMARADQVIDP